MMAAPKGGAAILQALSREETVRRAEPTAAFISMISHELRTPLTSIKGAAHLLLTADPDDTIGSQRAIAGIVRKNADRLVNLINDLIDLARVENDSLSIDPAPESLEEIVEEALRMVEPLATSRQATATVERDPSGGVRAMADYELALQATRHLIENAIKFGPMGGQVAISIKRENDWAVLTVSDRGEGIPESFRPLLFEKFTQGEKRSDDPSRRRQRTRALFSPHHRRASWRRRGVGF
jgi:signal transduction histidine kinase